MVGVAGRFHSRLMACWPVNDRQLSFSLVITSLSFAGSSVQELTPIKAKGLSLNLVTSDRS